MVKNKKKIAIINQRYGIEVNGGSEQYARLLAERLKTYYDVEVLTSCALEYLTWEDYFPEGLQYVNQIPVRRFGVDKMRDPVFFSSMCDRLFSASLVTENEENEWINEVGPLCNKLISYIIEHEAEYDVFIFVTYSYYLTIRGIGLVGNKAIFIPTAHDEPSIYLPLFQQIFKSPRVIFFLTDEERDFVHSFFHNKYIPSDVLGVGIELPKKIKPKVFKAKYQLNEYLIYVGRIDPNKECHKLFEFFARYKNENSSGLKLVLMGKAVMPLPQHPDIVSLGFVSDEDKYNGIAGAKILVLPSHFESLSISVLESLALGIPVIVSGHSAVLHGHCRKSNAGLYYQTYREFEAVLNYMLSHKKIYKAMKKNGRRYVAKNYNWKIVIKKLKKTIEFCCLPVGHNG